MPQTFDLTGEEKIALHKLRTKAHRSNFEFPEGEGGYPAIWDEQKDIIPAHSVMLHSGTVTYMRGWVASRGPEDIFVTVRFHGCRIGKDGITQVPGPYQIQAIIKHLGCSLEHLVTISPIYDTEKPGIKDSDCKYMAMVGFDLWLDPWSRGVGKGKLNPKITGLVREFMKEKDPIKFNQLDRLLSPYSPKPKH